MKKLGCFWRSGKNTTEGRPSNLQRTFSSYQENSWIPMSSREPVPDREDMIRYTAEDLSKMTNGFSEEMVLGTFDFGFIYMGKTTMTHDAQIDVTVKVWKLGGDLNADLRQHCLSSLRNEIELLTRPGISHPYLPKIVGCCLDNAIIGVVYHVRAIGILGKLLDRDDFVWTERVLVALRVAVLLNYLHSFEPPYLIRNLSANHILLDEFKNPIIFEFSMLTGGFLQQGQDGMADELLGQCDFAYPPALDSDMNCNGSWSKALDVHEFGLLLLGLLRSYDLRGDLISGNDVDGKTCQVAVRPLEEAPLVEFSYEELKIITGGFSNDNSIGRVQFGTLYKGQIQRDFKELESQVIVVKMWDLDSIEYGVKSKENIQRLKDEMLFLRHPRFANNPSLPQLLGFCCENKKLGIVYKLKAVTTLRCFMSQGSFRWVSRLKSMYQLACFLQVLHNYDPPYVVGNISSDHILVDEDYNMVLVDFGMMTGGMFGSKKVSKFEKYLGATGYIDARTNFAVGGWGPKVDVFVYGKLMTQMFNSILRTDNFNLMSCLEFLKNGPISSIIDDNFRSDASYEGDDAEVVVKIAYYCQCPIGRLTIDEIVVLLENSKFLNPLKSLC